MVQGWGASGFGVQGLGLRVESPRFRFGGREGLGFRV